MTTNDSVQLLKPHVKDLGGGFQVRRLLPAAAQQAVGPFIFFDHFGPVTVQPDDQHDVRPHPHIGLATLTYLFDGAIMHRDNLGYVQRIEPGAINWMTAGNGIVHSERRPDDLAGKSYVNHGLQLWLALPQDQEEVDASFVHTPADAIPQTTVDGATVRVLVGSAFGQQSPVATLSPTLYLDVQLPANATWTLPMLAEQQAVYAVQGELTVAGEAIPANTMAALKAEVTFTSGAEPARFVVIGGAPLGRRFMWWNFVSSSKEKIDAASAGWEKGEGSFKQVPGEVERIPLPVR